MPKSRRKEQMRDLIIENFLRHLQMWRSVAPLIERDEFRRYWKLQDKALQRGHGLRGDSDHECQTKFEPTLTLHVVGKYDDVQVMSVAGTPRVYRTV
jgi:hypothetical protein